MSSGMVTAGWKGGTKRFVNVIRTFAGELQKGADISRGDSTDPNFL